MQKAWTSKFKKVQASSKSSSQPLSQAVIAMMRVQRLLTNGLQGSACKSSSSPPRKLVCQPKTFMGSWSMPRQNQAGRMLPATRYHMVPKCSSVPLHNSTWQSPLLLLISTTYTFSACETEASKGINRKLHARHSMPHMALVLPV